MRRIILGTAGHIDHGKTTLVKALTGVDTDRLKEEKERGITIELGFARLTLPSGTNLGIIDVPGHERFVKNMVAGAMGIDLVALVIAADEGIMPQTREHLEICELLGVKTGIVVLTKKDLVEEDWLDLVKEDVLENLKGTFLEKAPIVAVSAYTGEGLSILLKELDKLVQVIEDRPNEGPFRLPIDRVFTIKGFGTVVTGTSISGRLKVGEEVYIYPGNKRSRVRRIQVHGEDREWAEAGMRTAINLQDVEKEEITRGQVVAHKGALQPSYLLDLDLKFLSSAPRPLKHNSRVRFHVGTSEVLGRIVLIGQNQINPGERALVQIRLEKPVACWRGDHFIIRSYSPIVTIGGGIILDPLARKRKRSRKNQQQELLLLRDASIEEVILYHIERAGIWGLSEEKISLRVSLFGHKLRGILKRLESQKYIKGFFLEKEKIYLSYKFYTFLERDIIEKLSQFHKKYPLRVGLTKENLRSKLPIGLKVRLFEELIKDMEKTGKIIREKEFLRLSEHKIVLPEEIEKLKMEIEQAFKKEGFCPKNKDEILAQFSQNPALTIEVYSLLIKEGSLVKIKDNLVYHKEVLLEVEKRVRNFLEKEEFLRVGDFRQLLGGVSRKYLIPLLEYLDSKKITLRLGDKRILRKKKN